MYFGVLVLVGGDEFVISGGGDVVKVWNVEKGDVLQELEGNVGRLAVTQYEKYAFFLDREKDRIFR